MCDGEGLVFELNPASTPVEHNELAYIDLKLPLMNLKVLCLDYNRLSTFDGGVFPNLCSLSMDGNHISSSLCLASCSQLKELSIRDQCGQCL
jgi:Leucine-rich repeat (LRR) protein